MPRKNISQLKFDTFGPIELRRLRYQSGRRKGKYRKKVDRKGGKDSLCRSLENACEGLSGAVGCYVFALGKIPWYVGKTEKLRFDLEVWNKHKLDHYDVALKSKRKAKPVLYFIAKRTPQGKFSKPSKRGHTDVGFLERLMIGAALQRNDGLLNKRETKYLRAICVPGFMNMVGRERRGAGATELSKVFGLT